MGRDKTYIQNEVDKQAKLYVENKADFIICEVGNWKSFPGWLPIRFLMQYIDDIVEMEWTIEAAKKYGLPVVSSMCIGTLGDDNGVSVGECGVRMVKAGADVGMSYWNWQYLIKIRNMNYWFHYF